MATHFSSSLTASALKLVFLILIPTRASSETRKHGAALFIFGDSFYDPGNNNYINTTALDKANFWPYGETFFKYPTGRFSDGRLVSDFIAEYAKLPLLPPFLQPGTGDYTDGANFASAGAGALADTFKGSVINLRTQLSYFGIVRRLLRHNLGNVEAKTTLSRGVYLFSIGTNDYLSLFLTNSTILDTFSKQQYVDMVIGNLTTAIREVYRRGGRRFGFMNMGELGCFPGIRALQEGRFDGCLEEASTLAKLHNEALANKLSQLQHQFKDFEYSLYDFNTTLTQLIHQPPLYGLKEGKVACCGIGRFRGTFSCGGQRPPRKDFEVCDDPTQYVFWDSYHLTQKAYNIMAHQMWAGGPSFVYPFNLSHLFLY